VEGSRIRDGGGGVGSKPEVLGSAHHGSKLEKKEAEGISGWRMSGWVAAEAGPLWG
jgi:hypothetical protein